MRERPPSPTVGETELIFRKLVKSLQRFLASLPAGWGFGCICFYYVSGLAKSEAGCFPLTHGGDFDGRNMVSVGFHNGVPAFRLPKVNWPKTGAKGAPLDEFEFECQGH